MSTTAEHRGRRRSRGSSEFRIGFLVHDVSRLRQILFDQEMKPHGVTRAQWWALAQLTRHDPAGGMTQAELARLLGLGKVAAGAMVGRLEAGGLVERRADAADRRLNRVYVTRRGQRVLERMIEVGRALNATIAQGIAAEELAIADRVLTTLRNRLAATILKDAATTG